MDVKLCHWKRLVNLGFTSDENISVVVGGNINNFGELFPGPIDIKVICNQFFSMFNSEIIQLFKETFVALCKIVIEIRGNIFTDFEITYRWGY